MKENYSSKQVSQATGLSIHTMRYYERIGLIDGIERDKNGYRLFSESDIGWYKFLNYFRAMGMPIQEMQKFAAMRNPVVSTLTARRELMETYRKKVYEQMKELERTLVNIDHKIGYFKILEEVEKRNTYE
ncbi:MerR family transcriptional regulator [Paenibacillus nasutitermitis]|uniref:Transcriptional regulator n=1 Tax=Paenibacillus nasutitermitis TaxID=1652958 RepID=A0A916YT59_9BACL|nr:MerR family transcriptional regulator [Paenibacillus nasutitermitis]GGD60454.1 transcriptional regulator [Paenibacillus nasutitermitis]